MSRLGRSAFATACVGLAAAVSIVVAPALFAAENLPVASISPKPSKDGRYLLQVTLHTEKEIDGMLTRAELLSKTLVSAGKNHAGIALVLHGPELRLFDRKNYKQYRQLVDKAARLDSGSVIEIKACRTAMDDLNIRREDIPPFIEIVPYGPDEEKRLLEHGYTYL